MAVHFNPAANNAIVQPGADGALLPLDLGQWQINDEGLHHLAPLRNLQSLDLRHVDQINDAALAILAANLWAPHTEPWH